MPTATKTIILGHTGFIGASFFRHCQEKNAPVLGFSSKTLDLSSEKSISALASHLGPHTAVCFFSAITRDRSNDSFSASQNTAMVSHVLEAIRKAGCSHLIFTSSIDVYGPVNESMIVDESTPLKPECNYSNYKLEAESQFQNLLKNTPLTILRFGGVYGPGDTHASPIRVFISSILNESKIKLYGEGKALRDYVFIEDFCHILERTISESITGTINVATGKSVSIINIVSMLEKIIGKTAQISFEQGGGPIKSYYFNPALFQKKYSALNFLDLESGLRKTCEYYASPATARKGR